MSVLLHIRPIVFFEFDENSTTYVKSILFLKFLFTMVCNFMRQNIFELFSLAHFHWVFSLYSTIDERLPFFFFFF